MRFWTPFLSLVAAALLVAWYIGGIVLLWVVLSAIGFCVSIYLTNEARRDLRALRRAGIQNGRRALTWRRLAREAIRGGTVQLPFLIIGLQQVGRHVNFSLFVALLIVANLGTLTSSFLDWSARYLLFETRDHEPSIPEPDALG